jgi:hypothetical protein
MTQIVVRVVLNNGPETQWQNAFYQALEKVENTEVTAFRTTQIPRSEWGSLIWRRVALPPSQVQDGVAWSSTASSPDMETIATNCDLLIDLTATGAVGFSPGVVIWRLERSDGLPLFAPFPFVNDAFKRDRTLTVYLNEWGPDSPDGRRLDVVRVRATGQNYRAMLREVLCCCESMLAANLRKRSLRLPALASPISEPGLRRIARMAPSEQDGIASLVHFFGRAIADSVWTRILSRLFAEQWRIGVVDSSISESLAGFQNARVDWLELAMPPGFAADPFSLTTMQNHFYCEVYEFAQGVGRIVEVSLHEVQDGGRKRIAQEIDFGLSGHLSYPYLFEENGAVFCIPECLDSREIAIFKQDPVTGAWKKLCVVLANVEAADPTLFIHNGYYWIGYTDTRMGLWNNYCLMYAEALEGVWRSHLNNPVKHDVTCSRPAGTPFLSDGRLYRPSQDCSVTYGGAIVINRIIDCTPETFREEVAFVLRPEKAGLQSDGIHTLAAWGDRTLIDGKRYVFSVKAIWLKVLNKLKRTLSPVMSDTRKRKHSQSVRFEDSKPIKLAAGSTTTKSDLSSGNLPR